MGSAKVLVSAQTLDGRLLYGTRHSLGVLAGEEQQFVWPWTVVAGASWSAPAETLVLRIAAEVMSQGLSGALVEHRFVLRDGDLLLDLVRERVQASVLLARTCPLMAGGVATVALRRDAAPAGQRDAFRWALDLPKGTKLSPMDAENLQITAAAVVEELGLGSVAPPLLLQVE